MKHRKEDFRLVQLAEYITRTGTRTQEVADRIGVTNQTIYNWISDPTRKVSPLASRRLDNFLRRLG
jgi:transposase